MISFVEQSYSPTALFALPLALGSILFLWKAGKWPFLWTWLVASVTSAAAYVTGSTIIDGPSALVGVAFIFALVAQAPVILVIGATISLLGLGGARNRNSG